MTHRRKDKNVKPWWPVGKDCEHWSRQWKHPEQCECGANFWFGFEDGITTLKITKVAPED